MAHDTTTYTITLAFWVDGQAATATAPKHGTLAGTAKSYRRDGLWATRAEEAAHDLLVGSTAAFVSAWLGAEVDSGRALAANVGFTARKSTGGGAGWALERGIELSFCGLASAHRGLILDLAGALRVREGQQSVVVSARKEDFSLVSAG